MFNWAMHLHWIYKLWVYQGCPCSEFASSVLCLAVHVVTSMVKQQIEPIVQPSATHPLNSAPRTVMLACCVRVHMKAQVCDPAKSPYHESLLHSWAVCYYSGSRFATSVSSHNKVSSFNGAFCILCMQSYFSYRSLLTYEFESLS